MRPTSLGRNRYKHRLPFLSRKVAAGEGGLPHLSLGIVKGRCFFLLRHSKSCRALIVTTHAGIVEVLLATLTCTAFCHLYIRSFEKFCTACQFSAVFSLYDATLGAMPLLVFPRKNGVELDFK